METHSMQQFILTTSEPEKNYQSSSISDYLALSDMEKLILHQVTIDPASLWQHIGGTSSEYE